MQRMQAMPKALVRCESDAVYCGDGAAFGAGAARYALAGYLGNERHGAAFHVGPFARNLRLRGRRSALQLVGNGLGESPKLELIGTIGAAGGEPMHDGVFGDGGQRWDESELRPQDTGRAQEGRSHHQQARRGGLCARAPGC